MLVVMSSLLQTKKKKKKHILLSVDAALLSVILLPSLYCWGIIDLQSRLTGLYNAWGNSSPHTQTPTHAQHLISKAYRISLVPQSDCHLEPKWLPTSPPRPRKLQATTGWHTHTHTHYTECCFIHVSPREITALLQSYFFILAMFF